MNKFFKRRWLAMALGAAQALSADELVLRSGQHIQGTYMGGTLRNVRFIAASAPNVIQEYPDQSVKAIYLGEEHPQPAAMPYKPVLPATPVLRAGTSCVVRLIDPIDSRKDTLGQTYRASLDQPIVVNGQTLGSRGSDVTLVLIDDQASGRIAGKTSLTVAVQSLTINGRAYDVSSTPFTKASASRGAQSAQRIGGGAALGAAIGGIAARGMGAAIGALSGAAAGTVAQIATSGQHVKVPSETRLTFTLKEDLTL